VSRVLRRLLLWRRRAGRAGWLGGGSFSVSWFCACTDAEWGGQAQRAATRRLWVGLEFGGGASALALWMYVAVDEDVRRRGL
jgi:hypothetical protein